MASCDVQIRLAERGDDAGEPANYFPGQLMHVTVTVRVDTATNCEGLELVTRLEGEGKGFSPPNFERRFPVFEGEWKPGTHTYQKEIPAPDFPPSYRGNWLSWHWVIEAKAKVPWAKDPSHRERFILLAPKDAGLQLELPPPEGPSDLGKRVEDPADNLKVGWVLGLGAVGLVVFIVGLVLRGSVIPEVWISLVGFGAVTALLLLVAPLIGATIRKLSRGPSDVAVALYHQSSDLAGDDASDKRLTCIIYTMPGVPIDKVRARLEINEFSEWGMDSEHSTRQQFAVTFYRRVCDAARTGTPGEWRCAIPLPDDPPYSVEDAGGHGLIWQVEVMVERAGGEKGAQRTVRRLKARPARSTAQSGSA